MWSQEHRGAAYFSGRPTTDKDNNSRTRTDRSNPDWAADEEMWWNVHFQHSQCDSIKTKTSHSVAAVTGHCSLSEASFENVLICLDVRIMDPSGETRGNDRTRSLSTKLQENTQPAASNCLNTCWYHRDNKGFQTLNPPLCCSLDIRTQCLLFYFTWGIKEKY